MKLEILGESLYSDPQSPLFCCIPPFFFFFDNWLNTSQFSAFSYRGENNQNGAWICLQTSFCFILLIKTNSEFCAFAEISFEPPLSHSNYGIWYNFLTLG